MKRENISRAILIALVVAAGVEGKWFSSAALTAHATQTQGRSLPTFEVDRAWPKVPPQSKQGQCRHAEFAPAGGCVGPSADQRIVRGRRLRQSPRRCFRCG